MDNEFEDFLRQHRDDFENGSPSTQVWEKLKSGLSDHHRRQARVTRIRRISWCIAASILLCIVATLVIFKNKGKVSRDAITRDVTHRDSMIDLQKIAAQKIGQDSTVRIAGVMDNRTRQSLYHYARLIDAREKQVAALQQIDPELYARSQKTLADLNEVYNRLKQQLPRSVDQQKILRSLIDNLKMQEQILTNQLQLIEGLQSPNQPKYNKDVKDI
jgi:hypothetical protein